MATAEQQTITTPEVVDVLAEHHQAALADEAAHGSRGVYPDEREETWQEVEAREKRERAVTTEQTRLRGRLDERGPKSCARAIYFEQVARLPIQPLKRARLLHAAVVIFSRGDNDLDNAFLGDAKLIERLGLGLRAKKARHRASRVALRRMLRALEAANLIVCHPLGFQAKLPAGVVGDEPWLGPDNFDNRKYPASRRHRRRSA
jgi:hypothetical protein